MDKRLKGLLTVFLVFLGASLILGSFGLIESWDSLFSSSTFESGFSPGCEQKLGEPVFDNGENSNISEDIIFRVKGSPGRSLVRVSVAGAYENGTWKQLNGVKSRKYTGENLGGFENFRDNLKIRETAISPEVPIGGYMPSFSHPVRVSGLGNPAFYPANETFFKDSETEDEYTVTHGVPHFENDSLKKAQIKNDPRYTNLSEEMDRKIGALARRITQSIEGDYERLKAIENYLENNYKYSENFQDPPPNQDPVAWFLLEEKVGTCVEFNSAFALLARSVGAPSRVVKGFSVDPSAEEQAVKPRQAHLRAEVLFENLGWVPFDATPSHSCSCKGGTSGGENGSAEENISNGENKPPEENGEPENQISLSMSAEGCKSSCSGPLFELLGRPKTHYARMKVGALYNDGAWKPLEDRQSIQYSGEKLYQSVGEWEEVQTSSVMVSPIVPIKDYLPGFSHPSTLSGIDNARYYPGRYLFRASPYIKENYSISHRDYDFSPEILRKADVEEREKYLQLPDNISEDVEELAGDITDGIDGPYKKLKAIEEYLESNYEYSKDYERAPPNRDPVAWFLFEEKKGVCSNFNSAFIILARSVGIPARAVGGFAIKPQKSYQVVTGCQAHLWIEVPFEGLEWVPFDATPGSETGVPSPGVSKTETETRITSYPERVIVGENFRVKGEVSTTGGKPVPSGKVFVHLKTNKQENTLPLHGGSVEEDGSFDLNFEIPEGFEVGEKSVVAHYVGAGKYEDSRSDPKTEVYERTAIRLDVPSQPLVHEPITVSGRLVEVPGGDGIGSQRVNLSLNSKSWSRTTDENGRFSIEHSFGRLDNYLLETSFDGSDYYLASENGAEVATFAETSLELQSTENETMPGETVRITASLESDYGGSMEDAPVRLTYLGKETENLTDESGECKFELNVPKKAGIGVLNFRLSFPGKTHFLPSENEDNISIIPIKVQTSFDNSLIRGEAETIAGTTNLEGKEIEISLGENVAENLTTDNTGDFETSLKVPSSKPLGPAWLYLAIPEYSYEKNLTVSINTRTKAFFPEDSKKLVKGDEVNVKGAVVEKVTENPVENARLVFSFLGKNETAETGEKGIASTGIEVPEGYQKEEVNISLEFPKQNYHLASKASVTYRVTSSSPLKKYLLISAIGVAAAVGIVVFYKKRSTGGEGKAGVSETGEHEAEQKSQSSGGETGFGSDIIFSSIEDRFPPVWSTNQPLKISVTTREDGEPIETEVQILIDQKKVLKLKTGGEGLAEFEYEFEEEGEYVIGLSIPGEGIVNEKEIRIVDYREEVIRLFNSTFKDIRGMGVKLRDETTPREFKRKVENRVGVEKNVLRAFIKIFEIANYSLHEIRRDEYEKFYLAYDTIKTEMEEDGD